MSKQIGFLITARLKSSRLPLKLLKKINDKEVITLVIDRVKEIDSINKIVLCTSNNPQDEPLIELSKKENINYFTGSEEDVLQRLLDAAKHYGLDYLIGITGENPLFSIEYTKSIIKQIHSNDYDFIAPKDLPIGCATYAIKVKALETVCKIKTIVDTEIWGYLINRPEIFDVNIFEVSNEYKWSDLRITIDYQEDFDFVTNIFKSLTYSERLDLKKVLSHLKNNPDLIVNTHKSQLDISEEIKKEINDFFIDKKEDIITIKNNIYNDIR